MRRIIGKSAIVGALLLGVSVGSVQAQEFVVNVPFPFVVNGQTLPAGKYDVQPVDMDPSVLTIRDANRTVAMFVLTIPADGHDPAGNKPALTFVPSEHHYRLTGIWRSESDGRALPRT